MSQFHDTGFAKTLFGKHIPDFINQMKERNALEKERNELMKKQNELIESAVGEIADLKEQVKWLRQ